MANSVGPYVCLHPGCQRHERYLYAMKRHIFEAHDIAQDVQHQGVDFGTEEEALRIYAIRQKKADVACWSLAKQLDRLRGADDFIWLCRASEK